MVMLFKKSLNDLRQFLFGSRWRILFSIWSFIIIFVLVVQAFTGNPNDRTTSISIFLSGLSTFLYWTYRKRIVRGLKRWSATPRTKFILIGGIGAVWVEFVFWLFEKIFGAVGVAAHPNFAIDLLATMPWYIIMIALLWKVEITYRYTFTELLLLGGIYELGADGFIGSLGKGTLSFGMIPLLIAMIPLFVVVYSFIILPCSSLLNEDISTIRRQNATKRWMNKYCYGLLPLIGLVPYLVLVLIM